MLTIKERLALLWPTFHEYAWFYPASPTLLEQDRARQFYSNIFPQLIFCPDCREHYQEMMGTHPPDVTSRDNLFRWTFDRHNDVTSRISDNQKRLPSYDRVYKAYESGDLPLLGEDGSDGILLLFEDVKKSLSFRERVNIVLIVLVILLMLLHRLLQKISSFIFC